VVLALVVLVMACVIHPPGHRPSGSLIDKPAISDDVLSSSGRLGELRRKALNPPVQLDVVDRDAALGEELFDVSAGEAEAQVPADREGDGLGREAVPGEGRAEPLVGDEGDGEISSHECPRCDAGSQCNSGSHSDAVGPMSA